MNREVRVIDPRAPDGPRATLGAYVALTKPRIIELLLVTTVPAMVLAADGWPGWWPVVATLVGGSLSSGGANAVNQVIDRDIDGAMRRTRGRPLPTGRVTAPAALAFGLALGVSGFLWLWATVGLVPAGLTTGGLLFYVFVYSLWLKRSTPQNIVIGGAAGAVPTLVGWVVVTGGVDLPAWGLFALVFYWTPPHFWALALRYERDYRNAGVPMLPVVVGHRAAADRILAYGLILVGVSLLLTAVAPLGWVYLATAAIAGGTLLLGAARLRSRTEEAMRFFSFSNLYLAAVFLAVAVDRLVGVPELVSGVPALVAATVVGGLGLAVAGGQELRAAVRGELGGRARAVAEVLVPVAGCVALYVAAWWRVLV